MYSELTKQAENVTKEIVEKAGLKKGQILVVGTSSLCSSFFFVRSSILLIALTIQKIINAIIRKLITAEMNEP